MFQVIAMTWPLLGGVMLMMVGNGLQSSLLGVRGAYEGFSTFQMSIVLMGYFAGFLIGSRAAPKMIQQVGHVRVFAALGSLISASLVMYPVLPDVWSWFGLRVLIGFSFSAIYVTTESWINNASTNENRGQALAAYMIAQMIGIVAGQVLLGMGDPTGYVIFILPAVLVSLSFLPILLKAGESPKFEAIESLPFRRLYQASPLGCVGIFLSGGIYSAMMGMASVWGMLAGLSVAQISMFISAMYVGGLVLQYPMGWISDRMDRRHLIFLLAAAGAAVTFAMAFVDAGFYAVLLMGAVLGGVVNPLYALLLAHTNDQVRPEEMAGVSSGLLFLNGLGAVLGPPAQGWLMDSVGPAGFFLFMGAVFAAMALYAAYRMTRRATPVGSGGVPTITPTGTALAVEAVLSAEHPAPSKPAPEAKQ